MDSFPTHQMDTRKIIFLAPLLLIACSSPQATENSQRVRYENTMYKYSLDIPADAAVTLPSQTGANVGFINFDHWKLPPPASGIYISVNATSAHCSPKLLGVVNTKLNTDVQRNAMWGKNDFFDVYQNDYSPGEEPNCRPLSGTNPAAYAFCSTKDSQSIVICFAQVTDNSEMVKQIFESFRWLD
jgi:hypothetical protein